MRGERRGFGVWGEGIAESVQKVRRCDVYGALWGGRDNEVGQKIEIGQ